MELFFMSLTTGIMVGGIYALVALGWVLIYKCSGVLNLAMGELTLIGAYVTYTFYAIGVPFVPAVLLTLLFIGSTIFTESITRSRYPEYAHYQARTSAGIPWPPKRQKDETAAA